MTDREGAILPEAARHWQQRYLEGRPWGDGPSELARLAVARLGTAARAGGSSTSQLTVADLGCGYGRDALFLAAELGCRVHGIDPAPAAIAAAQAVPQPIARATFEAADAASLAAARPAAFDAVFACNVYHLLRPGARGAFAAAAARLAKPGALLFLSTLAPGDPQHWGVGEPVAGEDRSWHGHVYLHFATAEELAADFAAFTAEELTAREYEEHNADVVHRHRSWFLIARRR